MPKVYLTEDQRAQARRQRIRRQLGDGLAVAKNRIRGTNKSMAHDLGMNHETFAKLLAAEDVRLSIDNFLRLIDAAGMEVKQKGCAE